ncbi:helix-turn-helix domain-containing protein [Ruegeria lacuscaerulensis]|uniref:helix-turn-helix domain-containing protein n=1 Tax=Ruegeria lacuscaerulensis TaxID=55218 RepID=UPI00147987F5|nr:helix-turn-helix domain-containing protein [Ruegeria lacuscaerulensis]
MSVEELKQEILGERPELKELLAQNQEKTDLALELLKLRKLAGFTKEALSDVSGFSVEQIDRLEAPSGDLPSKSEVECYKTSCWRYSGR